MRDNSIPIDVRMELREMSETIVSRLNLRVEDLQEKINEGVNAALLEVDIAGQVKRATTRMLTQVVDSAVYQAEREVKQQLGEAVVKKVRALLKEGL